jgi:preprotein translocase subunit SecD
MKKKNLLQRFIIIAIVTIAGLYVVIGPHRRPKFSDFTGSGIKRSLAENIRLGLDLKGGAHLVMRVKVEDYLKDLAEDSATIALGAAEKVGAKVKDARADVSGGAYRFFVTTEDGAKLNEIREEVAKQIGTDEWSTAISGNTITWTLIDSAARARSQQATEQAYNTIDRRINEFGVAEPTLQYHGAQGSYQILLQMPGEKDPERVKKQLTVASKLELVHVVSPPYPAQKQTFNTKEEAIASLGGTIPANRDVLPYTERDEPTSAGGDDSADPNAPKAEQWVVVEKPAIIQGQELSRATASQEQGANDFSINFSLKPSGAKKFGEWTGQNVNQYMGAVLDGRVKSIAFIKSQIFDSGQITGKFTQESADDLARTLQSGSLLAQVQYQEERTVGPSLGADSIRSGVTASLVGLGLVVLFMLIYYKGSGVNAVIALLLNMILTLAALVIFKATLTLPGIAGLILTIGMAVDSNVLIFERIREELLTGKTPSSAVDQGFNRAFVTIIDTHVTTIVSSLFLFVFGTGPIRGFAVTLILGLLINLFSAVYVSRTIFTWVLNRKGRRAETLSI